MRHFALAAALILTLSAVQSSHAGHIIRIANLDGSSEFPSNSSTGTGFTRVIFDTDAHTLDVFVTFKDLTAPVTAAHIHARVSPSASPPTVGVATTVPTFPDFPLGVTSGSYHRVFDTTLASTYNPSFVTNNGGTPAGAEAALFAAIEAGEAYLNIHTTTFPAGEIRGFLRAVPEPSSLYLLGAGVAGMTAFARRRAVRR